MAAMLTWCAWAENQLRAVALGEGLHVGFAGLVQGPTVVTARLRMLRPNRQELGKMLSATFAGALAQALQVNAIRITPSGRGVLVEIPSPRVRTPAAAELARHGRGLTVAIGLDQWRRPVVIGLADAPGWLAIGPSGRGKSEALKSALYGLLLANPPRKLACLILARKAASWAAFAPAAGCYGVLNRGEDIRAALAWLVATMHTRLETGARWPAIVLIVDDLANLAGDVDLTPLEQLASMGREAQVYLWLSTQTDGRQGGLTQPLAANMRVRLVFGGASASDAARFAGAGGLGAEQAGTVPGDCVMVQDGRAQRIATALSDPVAVGMLPAGETPKPWARAGTGETGETHRKGEGDAPSRVDAGAPPLAPRFPGSERFPLDVSRAPTVEEQALIRTVYDRTASKSATARTCYGSKNGRTWAWVELALAADKPGIPEKATHGDGETVLPDVIDLTTAGGRDLLAELQKTGALRWEETTL